MQLNCYKTYNKYKDIFVKPKLNFVCCEWTNSGIGHPRCTEINIGDRYLELPMFLTFVFLDKDIEYSVDWEDLRYEKSPFIGVVLFGYFIGFVLSFGVETKYLNSEDYFQSILDYEYHENVSILRGYENNVLKHTILDSIYYSVNKFNDKIYNCQLKEEYLNKEYRQKYRKILNEYKEKNIDKLFAYF